MRGWADNPHVVHFFWHCHRNKYQLSTIQKLTVYLGVTSQFIFQVHQTEGEQIHLSYFSPIKKKGPYYIKEPESYWVHASNIVAYCKPPELVKDYKGPLSKKNKVYFLESWKHD